MKKLKTAVTLLAALTMSVSAFVACGDGGNGGNGGNHGNPNEVQIYYWNSGYRLEFMKKIVNDFNASQTTYKAILDSSQDAAPIIKSLELGDSNPYDLYFTMLNTNQYNKQFIKLDDVLDSKADGENVTIREKYYDYLLNGVKNADGTYKLEGEPTDFDDDETSDVYLSRQGFVTVTPVLYDRTDYEAMSKFGDIEP